MNYRTSQPHQTALDHGTRLQPRMTTINRTRHTAAGARFPSRTHSPGKSLPRRAATNAINNTYAAARNDADCPHSSTDGHIDCGTYQQPGPHARISKELTAPSTIPRRRRERATVKPNNGPEECTDAAGALRGIAAITPHPANLGYLAYLVDGSS